MHNPNYTPNSTLSGDLEIQLKFAPSQMNYTATPIHMNKKLGELIEHKTRCKEFYYGIEISAHNFGTKPTLLDYNTFGSLLPLFTSLIWFGADYAQVNSINEVESIRTAKMLETRTNVLPHFTAYRVDQNRLSEFLNLNFTNVLALRGDQFDANQDFKYATEMIRMIRQIRKDTISIGVAGYPEGHTEARSLEDDIEFLAQKVKTGADFIITQVCFSAETIISFVRKCRAKDISIPIVIGIFVPENFRILERMMEITGAQLSKTIYEKYKSLTEDKKKFNELAVENAVKMIEQIFASDLDIYGVQFFTVNRFKNVQKVIKKLTEKFLHNDIE